jgi:hypothetical protein
MVPHILFTQNEHTISPRVSLTRGFAGETPENSAAAMTCGAGRRLYR